MKRRSPRKSAVAIPLVRTDAGELRALIGKRRSRFLGGFYAFPGGATDSGDGDPDSDEDACLRRTASRELCEETGIVVAPEDLIAAGRRVTPPFFPRRFDTLMYVAPLAREVSPRPEVPEEMEDLHWSTPAGVMSRWRDLEIRVAPPLIPILQELERVGEADAAETAARLAARNAEMEGGDGPHIEFVPDVLMVPLETVTLPPATTTNCYLVGSGEFVLIDPGAGGKEARRLIRHARKREAGGRRAKAVVLTHHHGDHVGGARDVARALGVPVLAHPGTWSLWAGRSDADGEIDEGHMLELSGGERLRVLHTPGHARGHVSLLEETRGSLFAGDLVSGLSTILIDPGPGSFDDFLVSLERIRDVGARTLFPAHGPPMISPAEDVQRALDHRQERQGQIVAALEDGAKSAEEIVPIAYADTPEAPPSLAATQVAAHLDHLERRGRVRREGGRWALTG